MMNLSYRFLLLVFALALGAVCQGQTYSVTSPMDKLENGYLTIKDIPDGNYRVLIKLGSPDHAGNTVIRGESRRLFFNTIETRKGEFRDVTFTINKRNTRIDDSTSVVIKEREKRKLNWDNNLTLEFNGADPQVAEVGIEPIDSVTTVYLCGNSTVVDQDNEPWASWGQMIPAFFNEQVCFANYAESGESVSSFMAANRFRKIMTLIKPGDYVLIEFGHNDQKQTGEGAGPYKNFYGNLREMVKQTREKGAFPVLVTPTQRRSFNAEGRITDTHGEYPNAMRLLAKEEHVPLIDLHAFTRTLYEALGVENSKRAFVHYPANTFPGQTKALEDNTHFNPYGAYEIAKCVIEGMKQVHLPLTGFLHSDYISFDPAYPDDPDEFVWYPSPFIEIVKPDGN
ncbi:MAG TPA: rhamnogalacturonan acetylesterase [Bacteroidales bacterium]|nr:rhamnogalacturonan acetylesterase [Bacteroidales bacterium]